MSGNRSAEFRTSAAECLKLATSTADPKARIALIAMAQKWLALANAPLGAARFDAVLKEFNDQQMWKR
jgi:hypothetical protein